VSDRIEPDQKSKAVYTVAMRFYKIPNGFYSIPKDPLYNPIGSHLDRIEPDHKPTVVCTVAMQFYTIPIRLL
jgi:hypothetical protein